MVDPLAGGVRAPGMRANASTGMPSEGADAAASSYGMQQIVVAPCSANRMSPEGVRAQWAMCLLTTRKSSAAVLVPNQYILCVGWAPLCTVNASTPVFRNATAVEWSDGWELHVFTRQRGHACMPVHTGAHAGVIQILENARDGSSIVRGW